jgi:hypothetical protein
MVYGYSEVFRPQLMRIFGSRGVMRSQHIQGSLDRIAYPQ